MFPSSLATVTFLACTVAVSALDRGLAWATNNQFAPKIGNLPLIKWYHHWQDGPVAEMPSKVEWVPMFWGPSKWDKWNSRKAEMNKKLPKYVLGFNEPDISGQANMDPYYAADVYMKEIVPFGRRGVQLGGPAIAWDLKWYNTFLQALWNKGGWVNFITVHWYGSHADIAGFKKYIQAAHAQHNMDIWITELGITSASNPSAQQIKNFMMNAFVWLDTQPYVKRVSWFGCFQNDQAPDAYATGKNALFKPVGQLNDLAYYYGYTNGYGRRRDVADVDLASRHSRIAAAIARDEDATNSTTPAVDCDEICEKRNALLAELEAETSS